MTTALFIETSSKEDELNEEGKRRLNVSDVLRKLGVSRSGYNSWKKHLPSTREARKIRIKELILEIYNDSKQNYGAPKITKVLNKQGEKISEKTVGNYMRELGIKAQYIKPYTVTTINSDISSELTNILDEQFNPDTPDAVWCSDITYIWTYEGFVYLTSIMDLYSRKIISWVLSMPYFEPRLIYDNTACRVGKGTHFAMDRLEKFLREHYKRYGSKGYILKFDIRKYFESIDHDVLKQKLEKFPDEEIKALLYHIIDSYEHTPGKGLPMGNQSSQWFALYYHFHYGKGEFG